MVPPSRRAPTQTEQVTDSYLAKLARDRGATPPGGLDLAAPHEVEDPVTGVVPAGPELDAARARRSTDMRVAILERKSDDKDERIAQLVDKLAAMSELRITTQVEGTAAAVSDAIAGNKARRDLIAKVVLGLLALLTTYLLGAHST